MWFIIGFVCGVIAAVVGMSLMYSAKEADKRMEEFMKNVETFTIKTDRKEES